MSQGNTPVSDSVTGTRTAPAGPILHALIRQGRSFSGRERNCCFLNLGSGTFADVSAASGLDFPDDGRAVARVDWDLDGDLDVWIANRSGPQVRFLRNDLPHGHHFLAVRLEGRTCNRDALGARLELVLHDGAPARIQTLRAGDGFLAQSSKWVHFGLGDATDIARLVVRWPGGEEEEFTGLKADGRYRLVQGSGRAEPWNAPPRPPALAPAPLVEPTASPRARVFSASQLPLPPLEYRTFAGQRRDVLEQVGSDAGQPVLLNLWASWCGPCVAELAAWSQQEAALRQAGVQVVVLSIDGLAGETPASGPAARETLERLGASFTVGRATAETLDKLQLVHDHLFDLHQPLAVPTSILIDASGQLAAFYRGSVDAHQIVGDVGRIALGLPERVRLSTPSAGRWHFHRRRLNPFHLVWQLLEKGYLDEALGYIEAHESLLAEHYYFHRLLVLAGNGRLQRGDTAEAMDLYRHALEINVDYVDAQNNLAWLLATHPDETIRDGKKAVQYAESAVQATSGQAPSLLDTLAAAYAECGRFVEAAATAQKAIAIARTQSQPELARKIEGRLSSYEAGRAYRTN